MEVNQGKVENVYQAIMHPSNLIPRIVKIHLISLPPCLIYFTPHLFKNPFVDLIQFLLYNKRKTAGDSLGERHVAHPPSLGERHVAHPQTFYNAIFQNYHFNLISSSKISQCKSKRFLK